MGFVALDVETANAFMGSICQIGMVAFDDDAREIGAFNWLINPQTWFDALNVSIHGIDAEKVANAPTFRDYHAGLLSALRGAVVVHHTHFDRVSIHQACARAELPQIECRWLDSAKVARRTWPDVAQRGYGLKPMAERLGFHFQHHDAEHDARAAGHIFLSAIKHSGLTVDDWILRECQPITLSGRKAIERSAGDDGPLHGETVVFTGKLIMPRRAAADLAHQLGAAVEDLVNDRTTILVVGDQDLAKLAGNVKSSKHRKADAMQASGHRVRIIAETDFQAIVSQNFG